MNNFPEQIRLETKSSLQDGSKLGEGGLFNLKKDGAKIVKNLLFRITLLIRFNNCKGKYPQISEMSLFKSRILV